MSSEKISFFAQWAIFLGLSGTMLVAAWGVVSFRNIVHAALSLAVTLIGVAGIYICLHAEFLAAVQVLVYVGGVIVLVLFAVLLTQRLSGRQIRLSNEQAPYAFLLSIFFLLCMMLALKKAVFPISAEFNQPAASVQSTGTLLLSVYVLPFEVASVLLLAAMVGAIYFLQNEKEEGEKK